MIRITDRTWVGVPLPAKNNILTPGGAKHHHWAYCPQDYRLYQCGGDGGGTRGGSAIQDMWSLDLSADVEAPGSGYRLEQDYCPASGVFPERPDEVSWVWDSNREAFWFLSGGQPFSNPCQGGGTAIKNVAMIWDPDLSTSTSVTRWIQPGGNAALDNRGVSSLMSQGAYDAASDKIYRFGWHGAYGQCLLVLDCAKAEQTGVPGSQYIYKLGRFDGNNHRLQECSHVYDPQQRRIYVYGSQGKLIAFDIPTFEAGNHADLDHTEAALAILKSDLPSRRDFTEEGTADQFGAFCKGVWDSVNSVAHWVLKAKFQGKIVNMYTFDPAADTWYQHPIIPPEGHTAVIGNTCAFDPHNNVLFLASGVAFNGGSSPDHYYLWRYAMATEEHLPPHQTSPEPEPSPESSPEPAEVLTAAWTYAAPVPSRRYMAYRREPARTDTQIDADRIETAEPWFRAFTWPVYDFVNDRVVYFGAMHGDYPGNDVEAYDCTANTWRQINRPHVPPDGDPAYAGGGSPNAWIDPETGRCEPYSIHGYGRIGFDPTLGEKGRLICTASFPVETAYDETTRQWAIVETDFCLTSYDPETDQWYWHLAQKASGDKKLSGPVNNIDIGEYDEILGGMVMFASDLASWTKVYLFKGGIQTEIDHQPHVLCNGAGRGGSHSVYIPEIKSHLIAKMPQGGKPEPQLWIYHSVDKTARQIRIPALVLELISNDGNFYMAYHRALACVVVLQAGAGGEAIVRLYDPIADTWTSIPAEGAPLITASGAVNRAPLIYDRHHDQLLYINLVPTPGRGFNWEEGARTWRIRLTGVGAVPPLPEPKQEPDPEPEPDPIRAALLNFTRAARVLLDELERRGSGE